MLCKSSLDIPELSQVWSTHDNYEVILNHQTGSNKAVIYFSSHGLYYPNESSTFKEKIIINNRFEWRKNIWLSARKVILIRDIKKQWYFDGISSRISGIEEICQLLKRETSGLQITCVGSSAGGFAATLFGCLLEAERVFNLSGQFSLLSLLEDPEERIRNPILVQHEKKETSNQFFSLVEMIEKSQVPIFYLYPHNCPADLAQAKLIESISNVFAFSFNTSGHAEICYPINFLDLFDFSNSELVELHRKFKSTLIDPYEFSVAVSGLLKTWKFISTSRLKSYVKNLIK
jgi:hypothetical protein